MLDHLKARNRAWAQRKEAADPGFFRRLEGQQAPQYLWIGCSDSRVPANEIVDLDPGELFVHRNVANLAPPQDANYLSVLQFAVDVLKVEHVLVVGHYGCGGVHAAYQGKPLGLIDNWLRHVQDVAEAHADHFPRGITDTQATARLAELNVLNQVSNVCRTTIAIDAWRRAQPLSVHGWIYGLEDGHLRDLGLTINRDGMLAAEQARAVAALHRTGKELTR